MLHFVEPMMDGKVLGLVAEMPFPRVVRAIAVFLEELGNGRHFLANVVRVAGCDHHREPAPNRDATRDEGGAPRRATRLAVPGREANALRGQPIQVGRRRAPGLAAAVGSQVTPAHIVRHEDDNIGFLLRRRRCCRQGYRCSQRQRHKPGFRVGVHASSPFIDFPWDACRRSSVSVVLREQVFLMIF